MIEIPVRMPQTRTRRTVRESPPGFKCQIFTTGIALLRGDGGSRVDWQRNPLLVLCATKAATENFVPRARPLIRVGFVICQTPSRSIPL